MALARRKAKTRQQGGLTPSAKTTPTGSRSWAWTRRALAAGLLGLAGLGTLAWWAFARPQLRRDPGLSVLLVSIDTLRADALGAYGRKTAVTPWIDRLAKEGVLFEQVRAHNVVTFPSHANMLSGRLPTQHGVRDNSGFRYPEGEATLATLLRAAGWRTGAFVSSFTLDSRLGLDAGFEVYDDRLSGSDTAPTRAFLVPERKGPDTVTSALHWLASVQGARSLAFVHLYEPHFPYEPAPPFRDRFGNDLYHGEVAAADAALEPLLRPILEKGQAARTLVVLTADHGESLGEHGESTHGIFGYEATLRVPLVLWAPGLLPAGRRVEAPARHVDLVPTLLDALAQPVPEGLAGRSLLGVVFGGGGEALPAYFEALSASLNQGWAPLRGVVRKNLKLIDLPLPELYDLDADPQEAQNLAASRPEDLDALRAVLARTREGDRGTARREEDAAALEKLRALGYVSTAKTQEKERYTEEDDPKRLIDLDTKTRQVNLLYREGKLDEAIALLHENLKRRPDAPLSYLHLAYLQRARGDLKAALAAVHRAFELKPLDGEAANLYAVYLTEAGRPGDALAFLGPLVESLLPNIDLLTTQGMALAALGRRDEALATFAKARELDPTNGSVLVNAGTVYLQAGDRVRARQALEAALELDPSLAKAHNGLGVIAAMEGRPDEAIERWTRSAALDPADYQTLFNLGSTLRSRGRAAEARPYLETYLRMAPVVLEARDIARVKAWLSETGP